MCNGPLEVGLLQAHPTHYYYGFPAPVAMTVPGTPTSWNPVVAFQQGLQKEPTDRHYGITTARCTVCGLLELYAVEPLNPTN